MKKFLLNFIKIYQKYSPFPKVCRYYPSCSEYMYLSLKKYGLFKGILKGILRILRCNSFFPGGEDMP